jgi:hypothetical protein
VARAAKNEPAGFGQQTGSEAQLDSGPTAVQSLRAMWLYSLLRFGLFGVLWLMLWLVQVPTLLAGVIAVVLSVPLSIVLLRKQRAKVASNLERRIDARRARTHELDGKLSGGQTGDDD